MFRLFLAFLAFNVIPISQVTVHVTLAFLEFLHFNSSTVNQMKNHISAIKHFSHRFALHLSAFDDPKVTLYLTSVQKAAPFCVKIHNIIDIPLLKKIVTACNLTYMGHIFKTIYLSAFFGFLRLSNLVPHSAATYSQLKHLSKGDIFLSNSHVTILLKWSKTLQMNNQARLLKLPRLNNDICPFVAIQKCLQIVPGGSNAPLFQFKLKSTWIPLSDSRVRRHLKNVLTLCQKHTDYVTFHSFRRSGATFAFNHNVPLQDIQRHGTWTSDCVWRYVTDSTDAGCQGADTFASLLS